MSRLIAHRNVALLRVSDPRVLDEIARVLPLQSFVLGRISDTELVIDPARIGELSSRLSEAGLPPLVKKIRSDPPVDEDITTPRI